MLYMSSLLQVEDVSKSDTKEHDREHANMNDKERESVREREGGKEKKLVRKSQSVM